MSPAAPDKLIVSNCERLTQKYGPAGATAVTNAVARLIKADVPRDIVTEFVDLSDKATMAKYGAAAIPATSVENAKLHKEALDKIFTFWDVQPSYLLLLGSTDVIPHVLLANPTKDDRDANVPSDLPYACDHAYSTNAQDFIAPTRVVGRLPSVTHDRDPDYLVGLLETAAKYKDRPTTDYNAFLGISAAVWKKSSELSVDAIFGTTAGMKVVPPDGYKWTAAEAKCLSHFINCHGSPADPNFYGQHGSTYPVAHSAAWMDGKVVEGTVLAAECCYGAQLYDPAAPTAGNQMGMCNTYLGRKAYAYFGSSTIAYGPDKSNDQADLLCQYFLLELIGGASAGRACLHARLKYANIKGGVLGPMDLKTLAQFNLMADPSITPVASSSAVKTVAMAKGAKQLAAMEIATARHARLRRRASLVAIAESTSSYRLLARVERTLRGKTAAIDRIRSVAARFGIEPQFIESYPFGQAMRGIEAQKIAGKAAMMSPAPKAVHVALELIEPPANLPHLKLIRGIQAIEYKERMDVQAFHSR